MGTSELDWAVKATWSLLSATPFKYFKTLDLMWGDGEIQISVRQNSIHSGALVPSKYSYRCLDSPTIVFFPFFPPFPSPHQVSHPQPRLHKALFKLLQLHASYHGNLHIEFSIKLLEKNECTQLHYIEWGWGSKRKEPKWKTTKNRDKTKQQPKLKQQHNALGDIVHDLMMGSDCPHQSELLVRQKPSLLENRDGRGAF